MTFRAYGPDGTTKDGHTNIISADDGQLNEFVLGDFHSIRLNFADRALQNAYQLPPPEFNEVIHLIPLLIGWFDKSDVIHSITPATVAGRPAKCIQFETVNGRTRESNEICVDAELGTLARWNVGEELIEDADFFQFEGVWLPGRIRQYINGKLRMEIEQKYSLLEGPIDWAALTPPNPTSLRACDDYRRPILQSGPQPPSAGAGPWYDVPVHSVIGPDGHVRQATVLPLGRPDLEKQAIEIVSTWVFSPAMCDGHPIPVAARLVVHFPPQ